MKTITFDYKKKDGSTSERTLLAMVTPESINYYSGIDISELDPNTANAFVSEITEAHNEYLELVKDIQARYDVKYNYRKFLVDGMTNVEEI